MMDKDKHNTRNLKKCVVGEGCSIDDSAKLTNCIVMRNVNIMANVVLEVTAAALFLRVAHVMPAAELHIVRLRCCATQLPTEEVRWLPCNSCRECHARRVGGESVRAGCGGSLRIIIGLVY